MFCFFFLKKKSSIAFHVRFSLKSSKRHLKQANINENGNISATYHEAKYFNE